MSIEETIIQELENFNQSIKDSLDGKNITNTGTAKDSLRIEQNENKFSSIGIFYLEFLDTGRGQGKRPPINKIQNWVKTKLGITSEERSLQVAFAVADKIAKLGTEIFRENSEGIQLEKKINELKSILSEKVAEGAKFEIIQKLDFYKKAWKLKQKI